MPNSTRAGVTMASFLSLIFALPLGDFRAKDRAPPITHTRNNPVLASDICTRRDDLIVVSLERSTTLLRGARPGSI
jgi:hypothetical protein